MNFSDDSSTKYEVVLIYFIYLFKTLFKHVDPVNLS